MLRFLNQLWLKSRRIFPMQKILSNVQEHFDCLTGEDWVEATGFQHLSVHGTNRATDPDLTGSVSSAETQKT